MSYPKIKFQCFKKALPQKLCNLILKEASLLNKEKGLIGGENFSSFDEEEKNKTFNKIKNYRDSDVVFLSKNFIYKEVIPFINNANQVSQWKYSFNFPEVCQYTEYTGDQYYNWHQDCNEDPYKDQNNLTRKLSCSILLNDPSEYDGGDLQFSWLEEKLDGKKLDSKISSMNEYNIREKGSLVVFPSYIHHRVTPVTRGIRKSLVIWFKGNPLI